MFLPIILLTILTLTTFITFIVVAVAFTTIITIISTVLFIILFVITPLIVVPIITNNKNDHGTAICHQMSTPTSATCNGSDTKLCSACRPIQYCSLKCQKYDWPLHKRICKRFATLSTRPSPTHKFAVIFPVDSEDPQLIWVNCEIHDWPEEKWEMLDVYPLLRTEGLDLKEEEPDMQLCHINDNERLKIDLSHTVQIICRENFLNDGSKPNDCVRRITQEKLAHP